MNKFILLTVLCLASAITSKAQKSGAYDAIDKFAESLGPLPSLNVAIIADTLTHPFRSKGEKARAIYYWITHNISLDPKSMRANDNTKSNPVKVIELRKATPAGFALLFQEMASLAEIRCLTVDGYLRTHTDQINERPDEMNHAWNVVQLGQSPTEWHYVDAARGSGILDKKGTGFIPEFTSECFFADRRLFNLDHFPDNEAWQLGGGPKGVSEFHSLPVIFPSAYSIGLTGINPLKGIIKSKIQQTVKFNLRVNPSLQIELIELIIGDESKKGKIVPMNFTYKDGDISFDYVFREEDEFPLTIRINSKDVIAYRAYISE